MPKLEDTNISRINNVLKKIYKYVLVLKSNYPISKYLNWVKIWIYNDQLLYFLGIDQINEVEKVKKVLSACHNKYKFKTILK